jgi:hypothetical protein
MNDTILNLPARLRQHKRGHPSAKIPWPHSILGWFSRKRPFVMWDDLLVQRESRASEHGFGCWRDAIDAAMEDSND